MSQYFNGFVSIKKGSKIVTGIDTDFISCISPGNLIAFRLPNKEVSRIYKIVSIESKLSLTIDTNFEEETLFRAKYAITKDFTQNFAIPQTFLGDEIIANFMSLGINVIEAALGIAHTGSYETDEITSIVFESSIVQVDIGDSKKLKVLSIPGLLSGAKCSFSFEPEAYEAFFSNNYTEDDFIEITAIAITATPVIVTATLVANTSITATCSIKIIDSGKVPLTSFTVPARFDVPRNGSITINPVLTPATATDNVFSVEKPIGFDTYFTIVSVGKSIVLSGKVLSSDMQLKIKHATCGIKETTIRCIDSSSALQTLEIVPSSLILFLFVESVSATIKFTPDLSSTNKEISLSHIMTTEGDFYKIISSYNISSKTISFSLVKNFNGNNKDLNYSMTTSRIRATNPLTGKYCDLVLTVKNIPTTGITITTASPKAIIVGETASIAYSVEPSNASNKTVIVQISSGSTVGLIEIIGTPHATIQGAYTIESPAAIQIRGVQAGSTKLKITTDRTLISKEIDITVSAGQSSLVTDIVLTNVAPGNTIAPSYTTTDKYGSFKVQFTPAGAVDKRVKVTSLTPLLTSIYPDTFSAGSYDYLTFAPKCIQYGNAKIKIETLDGSNLSREIEFLITGTVCSIPVSSIGFDIAGSGLSVDGSGIVSIPSNSFQKIFSDVQPGDASCQQVRYILDAPNSGVYLGTHTRDGGTSQYASTDDYVYVVTSGVVAGVFKLGIRGINNSFYKEISFRII